MRKYIGYSVLFLVLSLSVNGQITDSNTFVIEEYFQIEADAEIERNTQPTQVIESFVEVNQKGNDNVVTINSLQSGDSQVVTQDGYQNSYEYYNYYSQENSTLQVNQDGTLNSVQVFGENSLMKDAVINQKSDYGAIIIRNYSN